MATRPPADYGSSLEQLADNEHQLDPVNAKRVILVDTSGAPYSASGGGGGASDIQFSYDGVDTQVIQVTATPASNIGLPIVILSGQGQAPVDPRQIRALTSSDQVTVAASALPTGAATSANQTTANSSLSSIDTKTPALGQALMAASTPVVIASNQTAIPVSGTLTANVSLARIQTPVLFDGSTIQASGGTRQLVATLSGDVKRLDMGDTTGLYSGVYDALTSGNLLFIIKPGFDGYLDQTIASGTALYIISMTSDAGSAGSYLSINFLG